MAQSNRSSQRRGYQKLISHGFAEIAVSQGNYTELMENPNSSNWALRARGPRQIDRDTAIAETRYMLSADDSRKHCVIRKLAWPFRVVSTHPGAS